MSVSVSRVYLRSGATGGLVPADLFDAILPKHIEQQETHWKPAIAAQKKLEHGHWDWRRKVAAYSGQLRYRTFAIECEDMTQGLMIVDTIQRARIASQANKHLVYIEYLEAAPWNRSTALSVPKYKGIGTVMIAAAIQ